MSQKDNNTNKVHNWRLNRFSFYTMAAVAILYLVATIMSLINADKLVAAIGALQGIATAIMVAIVSLLAWRHTKNKSLSWKLLYLMFLCVVFLGIIVPLVV